jgi:hypothetical protein
MRFHLMLLAFLAFSTVLLAQVQEKPVEIDRLQAKVSLRIPSATAPPAADCDAATELGNIVIDTNDGSTGMVWICAGQAAGWIPMNLMRLVTAPDSTALPGFMELILPTTGENDCESRVALRLFGATQCLATLSDLSGLGGGGSDTDAIHDNVSGEIAAISEKTLPVAADLLIIEDSAASNTKKRAQAGKLSLDGGDSGAGTTRPSPSNIIGLRSHNTDCTTITDGKAREICCDEDDGACFVCVPSAGDCDTAGEWKRRDDTGAGGGDPVLISGNAVADASGVDLLGSGVIVVTFNGAVSPDTGTWSFVPANLTGTTTWGGGAGQTWAWDAGATDPTFTFASDSLVITNVATLTVPNDSWQDAEVSDTLTCSNATGVTCAGACISSAEADATFVLDTESPTAADIGGTFAAGLTVSANAVALGTDTTNNYIQDCTNGIGVTGCPAAAESASMTPALKYTDTLAGNPAFNAKECVLTTEGTSGGGFLCEGSVGANVNEQLHLFPALDGADTADFIATGDLNGACLSGDTATAFFAAGQIEAARGGTADDTSATTGVPRIAAGNWTYDAGVSHLAASTSADVRGVLSDESGTGVAIFSAPTAMTLDVEAGTNAITTVSKVYLPAATCQNATATANFDTPATNAPAAACVTGTNTQKAYLDFDQTTDESVQGSLMLPADWTGAIDVAYKWLTTAITGSAAWCLQLICVADAETGDPAFPAQASGLCVSDAAKGTTNQYNDATDTGVTATGCAAGELMYYRISRDPDQTSTLTDDLAADARLVGVEITLRRTE